MAIGDIEHSGQRFSASELRSRYDDLIKEAICDAIPGAEVIRADDVAMPGTITTDIIRRIMNSDYVVADVTFPNPNVFYELGLRHACRSGTIIIKDKSFSNVPFDISHLRHIGYENTASGLKQLSQDLAKYFRHLEANPHLPDNHFLEMAQLLGYEFPNYKKNLEVSPETQVLMSFFGNPDLLQLFASQQSGDEVDQMEVLKVLGKNPEIMRPLLDAMVKSGDLSFGPKLVRKPRGLRSKR